jgi:hypothetical protein
MQSLKDSKYVPKGMQSLVCSSVGARVCLRHHHHFASYHHIIPHNITSYIISHQQQKRLNTKQILGNTLLKQNVRRHEANFGKYVFIGLAKEGASFFMKHEKNGKCFFAEGSKNGMCVNFMNRKETCYSNLHVFLIVLYTKYYIVSLQ